MDPKQHEQGTPESSCFELPWTQMWWHVRGWTFSQCHSGGVRRRVNGACVRLCIDNGRNLSDDHFIDTPLVALLMLDSTTSEDCLWAFLFLCMYSIEDISGLQFELRVSHLFDVRFFCFSFGLHNPQIFLISSTIVYNISDRTTKNSFSEYNCKWAILNSIVLAT